MDQMNAITKKIDVLPMVKFYMDKLGVYSLFAKYVQKPRGCHVDPAQILSIMVANIVCASQPLYKIEQWAIDYILHFASLKAQYIVMLTKNFTI